MTLGTMRDRIADELGQRTDLNTQILAAIQSAIKFYESEPFWFNEEEGEATTTDGTASYTLPTDFIEMQAIRVNLGTDDAPDWEELRQIAQERMFQIELTADGEPCVYSIYRQELKLYPTPNDAFDITLCYVKSLAAISDPADTNEWMVEGEELIRLHAKQDVRTNVLNLPTNNDWANREASVFRQMKSRSRQMVATGRLEPTSF